MRLKWTLLILLQYEHLKLTLQSIAGVTYMDNFDFEERYSDFNECNPFYWYPLHMPERCTDMYEKLIRSRIASRIPIKIVRKKESILGSTERIKQVVGNNGYPINFGDSYPIYEVANEETYERAPMSPYEKMLDMVKKDIMSEPSAPNIQILPGLGPVAIYRQPISSKTEFMIKKIATAYAKAGQETYVDTPYLPSPYPVLSTNQSIIGKVKKIIRANKNKERYIQRKTGNGGVITLLESKHSPDKH